MTLDQQPLPSARDRLLTAAGELFYVRGINATGIDAVVERAGVALATLYKQFGGKDRLVAAYLEERDHRWRADWEAAIATTTDPRQRVVAIFDALERWWGTEGCYRGCAQVDAAVEITDAEHPAIAAITRHKTHLRQRLTELTREAGAAEPEQTAADIVVIYEGTITALLLQLVPEPLQRARRLTTELLPTDNRR
ncbi:AcrR family transcriptional regulator [Saccharopolyspora lacisalsi]|uniref:AcrR family transcriptional regulator n=1 Tax=Halosaccharopolyspora lacisalsi TaxID=1000566 RepID=A0A839DNA2_9PSEU|nr:TetR/AcrR family transcriptional regulator [Halosaccharopolyspora lacisalsi]MBA8823442.1 AcrR family transcriptional regulator [Halosaccharopolyspora lacisalsi]